MASPDGTPPLRDPGAQPERTGLAWRRTSLTFVVCIGLAVRTLIVEGGGATALLAGACGVLAWLVFLAAAHHRIAAMRAARPATMSTAAARTAVACTLVMGLVGFAFVL